MLSEEEIKGAWQVYWAGGKRSDEALELLIRQYSRLAAYFARQAAARAPAWQDVEDLLAFAHHGLLKAIQSYDPNQGAKFETWATRTIPKRILDGQRTLDRLKRPDRAKVNLLKSTREILWEEHQRTPTTEQLADRMGMAPAEVAAVLQLENSLHSSIDASNEGEGFGDHLHPHVHHEGEVEVQLAELRSRLALRLASLGARGRTFALHFYVDDLNMAEVARSVSVSPDWTRLTRNQVLDALVR